MGAANERGDPMTQKFTTGNVLRVVAEMADAADAADAAFNAAKPLATVSQVRDLLGDALLMAEAMLACWQNVADWAGNKGASGKGAVQWAEFRAAENSGPDDEEWDNRRGAAWLLVAARLRAEFL